jgi:hypothetical protein
MLISFVGAPCSGKTTTAAQAFGLLKEYDVACEFIPEQARWYIAELKAEGHTEIKLNTQDQLLIMALQADAEDLMSKAVGDVPVALICDSSVWNSLLYIPPEEWSSSLSLDLTVSPSRYDFTFYCPRVRPSSAKDPNRIHSEEESRRIDEEVIPKLQDFLGLEFIPLYGDARARHAEVVRIVLDNMQCS